MTIFWEDFNEEFDPGSGWTLAERLTHASRTGIYKGSLRTEFIKDSGRRVSNACLTYLWELDNCGNAAKPTYCLYDESSIDEMIYCSKRGVRPTR